MERWLLISNCQTFGLVNSLRLMCPDIEVEGIDVADYRRRTAEIDEMMGACDRVVLNHEVQTTANADHRRAIRVSMLPAFAFGAYHPDLTYVLSDGQPVEGPNNHYHSAIAFAAYCLGLSVDETERLFTGETFARFGFYDHWQHERDSVVSTYASHGMDVAVAIRQWGRVDPFMWSTNHPKIRVLYDLARIFLLKEGYQVRDSGLLPHDNLVLGPCFPVYPAIGEQVGVSGNYYFKRLGDYRQLDLREFLIDSFRAYDRHEREELSVMASSQALHERLLEGLS